MGWGPRQSISGIKLEGWSGQPGRFQPGQGYTFAFTLPVVVEQQINADSK